MSTVPYLDLRRKSDAYAAGLRYCARVLEQHGTTVERVTDDELRAVFTEHRLKRPADAKLSYGSVRYMLSVLKRARPDDITLTASELERDGIVEARLGYLQRFTPDVERRVKETVLFFTRTLARYPLATRDDYERAAPLVDTCVAVVLTLATNLRSSELKQITYEHLDRIFNRQPVPIRVKMRRKSIVVVANVRVLKQFMPQFTVIGGAREHRTRPLVSASVTTINRLFREAFANTATGEAAVSGAAAAAGEVDTPKLGIQAIRKINTTVLIEHGTLGLAQAFNRHASSYVTDKYYNTGNYISSVVGRVFRST